MSKSQVLKFTLASKNVLTLEETELYELTQLAGITMDPSVFKIILDLLKLNVDPTAVFQMLSSMSGQRRKKAEGSELTNDSAASSKQKYPVKGRQLSGRQRPDYK